eukprot:scaffold9.g3009.t1
MTFVLMPPAAPAGRQRLVLAAVLGALLGASLVANMHSRGAREAMLGARVCSSFRYELEHELPPFLVLPADAIARGLGPLGSGGRLSAFAAKLLAGQPVTVVMLGGSVTYGAGASLWFSAYPILFADWLLKSFPRSNVTFLNHAIPASTSGLSSMCSERLVPEPSDLVVVEFTQNDPRDASLGSPQRWGIESLLRRVLGNNGAPAAVLLHHYAYWLAQGDGHWAGWYPHPSTEADFTTLAAYYDVPSLSLRAAVHPLMRTNVTGFRVDKVTKSMPTFEWLTTINDTDKPADFFYADGMHPSDTGHQALADLLIALVQQAVAAAVASPQPGLHPHSAPPAEAKGASARNLAAASEAPAAALDLPPPMQSGVVDAPMSVCLMQEDFRSVVVDSRGFEYRAERPNGTTFVGQKWGWTSSEVGAWAELEIDTRTSNSSNSRELSPSNSSSPSRGEGPPSRPGSSGSGAGGAADGAGGSTSSASPSAAPVPAAPETVTVHLGYTRSWRHMGKASVECVSGCTCKPNVMEGNWERHATLQQSHAFEASQAAACRLRVTVINETSSGDHKIILNSVVCGDGRDSAVPTVAIVTCDGRNIVGLLRGYDQATNLILDECHERIYSTKACGRDCSGARGGVGLLWHAAECWRRRRTTKKKKKKLLAHPPTPAAGTGARAQSGVEQLVLGLYVIRGDNVAVIGEVDEELDAGIDFAQVKAAPLKPVTH